MQYAFKKGTGTTTCSLMLKEVVHYYNSRGSAVYCAFLDATKAFDRLRFDKLFELLMRCGIRSPDLRLLLDCYRRQQVRASWKGSKSEYFDVENGIRQGGIASPTLFCIYLDRLLCQLKEASDGCWVGPHFLGCLAYADDVTLMAPTLLGLQRMLKVCETFCEWSDLSFNATKSVAMVFGLRSATPAPVVLNGCQIQWATEARHLGNVIRNDCAESSDVVKKKGDLIGRTNIVCATFPHQSAMTRNRIFQCQCCHLYGCQAWNLYDRAIERFVSCHNRCLRRVLHLPYRTHRRLLPALTGSKPCMDRIVHLSSNHIKSMVSCPNSNVAFLANHFMNDKNTTIGCNRDLIDQYVAYEPSCDELCTATAINDLLYEPPDFFLRSEATELAHWLCVN